MKYKTKCVTTKNENVEEIDKVISEMFIDGWELFAISSVHLYTDFDNDDYFNHFLVFIKSR